MGVGKQNVSTPSGLQNCCEQNFGNGTENKENKKRIQKENLKFYLRRAWAPVRVWKCHKTAKIINFHLLLPDTLVTLFMWSSFLLQFRSKFLMF